jgi:Zn-dependent protease
MDGGRVIARLSRKPYGLVRATERAASIGQFTAFVLGFIGLFHNPILFIAVFVYRSLLGSPFGCVVRRRSE